MTKRKGSEKRKTPRASVRTKVEIDYQIDSEDTFLFEYASNVSRDGIFLQTKSPLEIGTRLMLKFELADEGRTIETNGEVMWINPYRPDGENINPGMGINFIDLSAKDKEAISRLVGKKAYLAD
ncbi:MAG: TIGR02266 family protein [Candidatus Alcyoniella australis]|nr:TIGR02266 family protein [Candidatus Alcyoniella australis]